MPQQFLKPQNNYQALSKEHHQLVRLIPCKINFFLLVTNIKLVFNNNLLANVSGYTKRVDERQFPRKPGYGKVGRPINLLTNCFALSLPRNDLIYHYDVTIEPEAVKSVYHEVMQQVYDKYGGEAFGKARPAFDGSRNLYAMKDLPIGRDGVCWYSSSSDISALDGRFLVNAINVISQYV